MEKNVVQNGARPKTQIFEMQCPNSGDSHSESTDISEKGHDIQITVAYHDSHQPGQIKTARELFSCTIDEYVKWKYILNSHTELDLLNAHAHAGQSAKFTLRSDASMTVAGIFQGKTRELAQRVFRFATHDIGKKLTWDLFTGFSVDRNEELIRNINKSELGKQMFLYAETIQQTPVVVFPTRFQANVQKIIDTMQKSNGDRRITSKPAQNITRTFPVDLIWMKKANARNIQSAHQSVLIKFNNVNGNVHCVITGPETEVQKCVEDLHIILQERIVSKTCKFAIIHRDILSKLDLTVTLDQLLAEANIISFTIQNNNNLLVYAFESEHAEKACQKINECVIERPYIFESKYKTQQTECLRRMQNLYKNLFAVKQSEIKNKVFIIGFKEAVVSVTTELDSVKANRNSAEENRPLDSSETLVFYHDVKNEKICEFLGNSTHLSRCLSKMDGKVIVAFTNSTKKIRVICPKTRRTEAEKLIKNAESETFCKLLKFDNTAEKDFVISDGKQYMAMIAEADDVLLIERIGSRLQYTELNVLEETTFKPNRSTEKRFCWAGKYEKRLHIQRLGAVDVPCSHQILFHPYSKSEMRSGSILAPTMTGSGLCTNVHLPEWVDGKSGEKQQLRSLIATILDKADQDNEDCLAMCLDPVDPWTPMTFTSELALEATNWIANDSKGLKTAILFSLNDQNNENAINSAHQFFKTYAEDGRRSQMKTVTQVYEGELNTVKADVLVNTAAANLELKHGKVSAALLATAGNELQAECTNTYPRGIVKHQVAETEGYRLKCKKVYHITLEKFSGEDTKSMVLIEDIRESMRLCMDRASNAGFKTIAFPALGTGTLKYPVDMVASAMFKSVKDFKRRCPNTTLECVLFVIYPKDTGVLEYFKHVASDLDKTDESDSVSREVEIIGFETNVQNAESKIINAIETAKNRQIVRHLKNVTEAQYYILLDFDDAQKATKSLENIQYDKDSQVVILTGKRLEMEKVLPMLEKHLQYIQAMKHIEFNVQEYSKSKISENVTPLNEKYKDVKCALHQTGNCVYIYGKKDRLDETKEELLRLLKREVSTPNRKQRSFTHQISTSQVTVQAKKSNEEECDILKSIETTIRVPAQSNVKTGKNDIPTDSNKDDSPFRGKIQYKDCVESQADDKLSKEEKQQTATGYLNENFNENTISRVGQKSSRKLQEVDAQFYKVGSIRLYAITSNILDVPVDCIVNAANADLSHCGGVAFEISEAAGEDVQRECNDVKSKSGPLSVGSVVQTTQGRLNCKMLLHAVGPRWDDYKPISEEKLKKCMFHLKGTVINCMFEANKHNMKSIALPTISSGLFRVPKELCAVQYSEAVIDFAKTPKVLERIYFVDTSTEMIDILKKCFSEMIEKNQKPMFDLTKYIERNSSTENVPTNTVITRTSLQNGNSQTSEETNKTQITRTETNNNAAPAPIKLTTETSENKHLAVKVKEPSICEGNNKGRKNTARSKPLTKIRDTTGECPGKVFPVCSESGGIFTCTFNPMYQADIYSGDIFNLAGVECLVCQVGQHGEPVGNIARTLQQTCSSSYIKEKAERFKSVQIGDAVITHSGHRLFNFIIHTFVSKHSKNVGLMYKNILTVLRDEGITSAVLPLLGTDESEEYGPDAVTKILFKECLEYCKYTRSNKLTLHLVVADENLAKQVQRVFKRCTEDVSECLHLSQIRQEGTDKPDEELNTDNGANTKHETSTKETEKEETCVICMDDLTDAKRLRCGHTFCKECIDGYFKVKQVCPTCGTVCGIIFGNQPDGIMEVKKVPTRLTGFERFTAIAITYQFHDGQQWPEHPRPGTPYTGITRTAYLPDNTEGQEIPRPGTPYTGITRTAYLPDNTEGQEICALLTVAFSRRLVFTIGTSRTTGKEGVITWNDIHHKTDPRPNTQFGYPDATYLQRVREEIKVKGVKLEDVSKDLLKALTNANFKHVFGTDTRL